MADRFPLILNTSTNQIQEIPSGDSLDLTGSGIANAGIITAGNVTIGAATTDLIVSGNARVTGILTVGTGSLTLNGPNNLVNVGTALTLGHTQGLQFHTQNLHSAGFEVNQINVSGVITATTFKGDGDFVELDVDGHTNLDNVSIAGVVTSTLFSGPSQIGIQSAGTQIGAGITQLNFVGAGNTFKVTGTTVDVSISGNTGAGGTWNNYNAGIATTKSVGINTSNFDDPDVVGAGNSFQGLYISNGMMITDNSLHGNHYIGTAFNGLMAGPVTIHGTLTVDGNYVVV